ncbi:pentatricopeptide repeat-containing protein At3g22690-like [Telopea speciosissima]|uniref:pentatricopeptide repeat-containing protein At3g22690-like n=1 Tax=Telopea speciosissima TaxID=54955 RepID=UPI001CC55184|nr:pentatricopeptide repeat-containing protein At3g22690-like [Telopea speciosissima]
MIRTGLIQDIFLVSRIIAFLTNPSAYLNMHYARHIFDQIHHPNEFIWNSMFRGYTQGRAPRDALLLYKQMLLHGFSPDNYTYPIVTKACSHLCALQTGKLLHGQIVKLGFQSDVCIMSGVISFYVSCRRISVAREIFDEMPERDVVAWTTMISGYSQLGCSEESFLLLDEMERTGVKPNNITIMSLLSACGNLQALDRGRCLHSYILENNMEHETVIANALINMYAKCGIMSCALEVFETTPMRNAVTWNTLISGFIQNGLPTEAMRLFREMECSVVRPNEITVVSALSACAQMADFEQGKILHLYIKEKRFNHDVFVGNALINMYSKCGDLDGAMCVFHQMPDTDVISWTTLITGYVHGSKFKEALAIFQEVQLCGVKANEVTLVSLLSACSQIGALGQGKLIHAYIEEHNVKQDLCLGNALIDMYAKCGCIESALWVFHGMSCKDTFSWNAMIGGLAMHGHGKVAIDLFTQMQRIGETIPDDVTFITVLSACSHTGMVLEGYHYFKSMSSLYGITPSIEHYGCMVDLLSRASLLEEARKFIVNMPIEPNSVIWGSLLSACRFHGKVELGEKVAEQILKLTPDDKGVYVLLSNMYANLGRWNDAKRVRTKMENTGIEKSPGCSSIEVNGVVHEFYVGEIAYDKSSLTYLVLNGLMLQSKELFYQ